MSAEFRRNVWLELTPHRLASMPLILGAIFYLAWLVDDTARLLRLFSWWALLLLGLLWGTRLAAESVIQEVNARTWDGQRTTSMEPWSMTWGKLLGSTVHVWYGCAFCAGAFVWAGVGTRGTNPVRELALLAAAIALAHAAAFALGLLAVRKAEGGALGRGIAPFFFGLLAGSPILFLGQDPGMAAIRWWGTPVAGADFVLVSVIVFAAWAVAGAWRLMRAELQVRNAPWVWCAFVVYAMGWAAGLAGSDLDFGGLEVRAAGEPALPPLVAAVIAYAVGLGAFWLMLVAEPKDPVSLRLCLAAARRGAAARALGLCPRWVFALALAAVPGAGVVVLGERLFGASSAVPAAAASAVWLFALRDAGLVMWLNGGRDRRRSDAAAVVYLLVLYGLAPPLARLAGLGVLTPFLLPDPTAGLAGATVPVLIEAIAVWGLALRRWRRSHGAAP